MENEQKELQNREISGITAKQLVWFMGGVISIVITVVMCYASIMSKIADNSREWAESKQLGVIRDTNIEAEKSEIQLLKTEVSNLNTKISMMQPQLNRTK